jgi:MOSC domain-containing protein YiiM
MPAPTPRSAGELVAIYLTAAAGGEPREVDRATAVAATGLADDRYAAGYRGAQRLPLEDRQVTLIEAETLDALARDHGLALPAAATRRNLVTRGVALNHLVGRELRIGEVVLRGRMLCEPCSRLARFTSKEVVRALIHRGGLRAEIVVGGELRRGAAIRW